MKFYDDDMDELFNKAGRDYPLKTDPKNWDAVRAALHPEDGTAEVTQKRNGWRRLLPLLFLLLIPAVYVFIDKDNIVGNSQQDVKPNVPTVTKNESANTNSINERTNKVMATQKQIQATKPGQAERQKKQQPQNVHESEIQIQKANAIHTPQQTEKINQEESFIPTQKDNSIQHRKESLAINEKLKDNPSQTPGDLNDRLEFWNHYPALNNELNISSGPAEVISMNTPLRSLNQSPSVPHSDKNAKAGNRKGFYLGILTAPDISTIKGQAVKGIGYSAGAIVGYTLNNRWQFEGGVLWSNKKYYTDGKYFDKKGPGIPDNINVLWLDGGCEMFEFPVIARYNFSQKKNTFFGSAGLTSYIMKKEDYNYEAVAGGGNYPYKGYRAYDRSGDHLFANLQISAGYNFSLSSKYNIRIEPYLKAPLKKIGIGKMPVTSTGLYFALTRDFR